MQNTADRFDTVTSVELSQWSNCYKLYCVRLLQLQSTFVLEIMLWTVAKIISTLQIHNINS